MLYILSYFLFFVMIHFIIEMYKFEKISTKIKYKMINFVILGIPFLLFITYKYSARYTELSDKLTLFVMIVVGIVGVMYINIRKYLYFLERDEW